MMLPGRMDSGRSSRLPVLRNFVEKPPYGPKSRDALPSTTRVSRCGTDMGGAPTEALP